MATKIRKKNEFSKTLLIQESALMWVETIGFLVLAFVCVLRQYDGALPWLTAMASLPWATYGVSQVYYYKKSLVENSKNGIKYETVLAELNQKIQQQNSIIYGESFTDIDLGLSSSETDSVG